MKHFILILLSVTLLAGCGAKTKKTTSGTVVTFFKEGKGEDIPNGHILMLNMKYLDKNGKELFNTTENFPLSLKYEDSVWNKKGQVYEAFNVCRVGDSVTFKVTAEELFVKTFFMPLPDSMLATDTITFYVGFSGAYSREEHTKVLSELMKAKSEKQKPIDDGILMEYFQKNNITAQKTESGLYYVISQNGTGENAKSGQTVTVHYAGTLLDGTKFDASYDRNQPFTFVLGSKNVITGWDEGFTLLNTGAKATLYIPSHLAYGNRQRGPVIKPNSILKFDVELLEVK